MLLFPLRKHTAVRRCNVITILYPGSHITYYTKFCYFNFNLLLFPPTPPSRKKKLQRVYFFVIILYSTNGRRRCRAAATVAAAAAPPPRADPRVPTTARPTAAFEKTAVVADTGTAAPLFFSQYSHAVLVC